MKQIIFTLALAISSATMAQLSSLQLSPLAKLEQTVGLTNVAVEYSRPQKNNRNIFPDVVAYGQVWRAGANKNSILTTDDKLVFGKDTLNAGSYAIFVKPEANQWTLIFYKSTNNWGVPAEMTPSNIALEVKANTAKAGKTIENFTIAIDNVTINGASLTMAWDNTFVAFPFTVLTDAKMQSNITKVLAGPSANDYYRAADYLLNSNGDMKAANEYITKAVAMYGENTAFHVYRKMALIQANLGDYKTAIETAKKSTELAKAAGNMEYVRMNDDSIKDWSKKK